MDTDRFLSPAPPEEDEEDEEEEAALRCVKRRLLRPQRRPTREAKEMCCRPRSDASKDAYCGRKGGLLERQKRTTTEAKEMCCRRRRDLLQTPKKQYTYISAGSIYTYTYVRIHQHM